jgi:hypothetical protein
MPGLTDAHWHMTTAANTMDELQQADTGLMYANTVVEAQRTVLRGFTASGTWPAPPSASKPQSMPAFGLSFSSLSDRKTRPLLCCIESERDACEQTDNNGIGNLARTAGIDNILQIRANR